MALFRPVLTSLKYAAAAFFTVHHNVAACNCAMKARVRAKIRSFASSAEPHVTKRKEDHVDSRPRQVEDTSFIGRAKLHGAETLLGKFVSNESKFDRVLHGLNVIRVSNGEVEATLEVTEGLQNSYGGLHGGATCTLVDVVGTMALISTDPTRAGVSVDLSVSFTNAAKKGETIRLVGRVLKTGKRLGFTEVQIYRVSDGALVATGRHTKAL